MIELGVLPDVSNKHTIDEITGHLKRMDATALRHEFEIEDAAKLLKSTISLCEVCLSQVSAAVYSLDGKVWKKSSCQKHGLKTALLENNLGFYRLSNKDSSGVRYANNPVFNIPEYSSCCGSDSCSATVSNNGASNKLPGLTKPSNLDLFSDQMSNKTCTVLIEITNACNLACRVCYANASGDRIIPFNELKTTVDNLIDGKGFIDSVQVTGGEATIHPEFWDIVGWLYTKPEVGKIYLPTNGLEFSKPEIASRLKDFRDKVLVLLQFDGELRETNQSLRRADTKKIRQRTIKQLAKLGICMQLTMTVVEGVSEQEIAWVIKQGLRYKHIRLVGFLPAFFTGRYQLDHSSQRRTTLSDVISHIAEAMPDKVTTTDFLPIPCSHPNCGWTTLFARRFGLLFNITQKINLEAVMNEVAYKTILDKQEIQSVIGRGDSTWLGQVLTTLGKRLIRPRDVFGVAIKPFMDRYTYDHDRVSNCCHHILNTEGQLVSFCEYNTRLRNQDSWNQKPRLHGTHLTTAKAIMDKMDG